MEKGKSLEHVKNLIENVVEELPEDKKVVFDGVIQVESLCNEPVFDVERVNSSSYSIDVRGNDTYAVRSCHDHPTKVEYSLTLQTQSTEMEVIVNQNNVTESFQTEEFHEYEGGGEERLEENTETEDSENNAQEQQNKGGGLLSSIVEFIMNL